MLRNTMQDLRFALRQLLRSPGFTLAGVLTLTLAIGATCIMFSLVQGVLLSPLPYPEAQQLVGIGLDQPGQSPRAAQTGETAQFLLDHAKSFSSLTLTSGDGEKENFSAGNGHPIAVPAMQVSSGYVPTLGVLPLLGRSFTTADDTSGVGNVVMISEGLWRGALGGDLRVIGRTVRVNGDAATVIGVMPAGFATVYSPDLWHPLRLSAKDPGYVGTNYEMTARLRPGVTLAEAQSELHTLTPTLMRVFPHLRQWTPPGAPSLTEQVWPLQEVVAADSRPGIVALSAAVLVVLLIACLNLAALMTARIAVRQSELAVRSALGAGRGSLLRLILGEGLLLAITGALLGVALAYAALPILLHYAPLELPKLHAVTIDLGTALCAGVAGLGAMLLVGLLPALAVLRRQPGSTLAATRGASASASKQRLGRSLLVTQVALATTLLAVGSVLLGTFVRLRTATPGIDPEHLDVLQVQLKGQRYESAERTGQFVNAAINRLVDIAGVRSAAAIYGLPLDKGLNNSAGPADRKELVQYAETRFITPGYLRTVGTPLLAGEDFSSGTRANTQPVALISDFAAKRWFASTGAALDRMVIDGGGPPLRVLGVVGTVHLSSLADTPASTVYLPIAQLDDKTAKTANGWFPISFVLRVRSVGASDPDVGHAAAAVRRDLDADIAVSKCVPMQSFLEQSYAAPRFFAYLAGGFAGFSLLLTVIGLFGLLSYQVSSRTREIGVRMAVGASRVQVAGMIVRRGLLLKGLGLVAGIVLGALLQTQLMAFLAQILQVSLLETRMVLPNRGNAFLATAVFMLFTALIASLLPAVRAAQTQPTEALRAE